jgi:hypothetical protein
MGFPKSKLSREQQNQLSVKSGELLGIHEWNGGLWLYVKDPHGNDILRIYDLSEEHLVALYSQIAARLRFVPSVAIAKLRKVFYDLEEILLVEQEEYESQSLRPRKNDDEQRE